MDNLLTLHLKEEWRMITSYFSSEKLFLVFPLVLAVVGFSMAWLLPFFKTAFNLKELLIAFHLLLGLYGLFVGAFGFFADEVAQTWFRDAHLLIHLYTVLPITFRKIFVWFYIKDIVYYLLLTIFPLFVGAFLSFQIPAGTFARVFLSSVLSFLMGVSVSFVISSLYVRVKASIIFVILILIFLVLSGVTYEDFPPLVFLFERSSFSLIFSVGLFVVFSAVSLVITKPVQKAVTKTFSKSTLFSRMDPVLAKEIIDVKRSGTYQIIATSYLFPLFFFYGILYFSTRLFHFSLVVPLVFYAVFIGYLSTLVYSWLNNIDPPSSMVTLPVTTAQVIKKKITLFLIFSFGVALVYLVILGYLLNDFAQLPLSVVVMGSTAFYVAAVTAWLCGLYPNTQLFDGSILAQYLGAILPVLILLSILSFMEAYFYLFVVSLSVLLASFLVYRTLDAKYENVYL